MRQLWSSSWCWMRSRRDYVWRHLFMLPGSSGALCSGLALPCNSLCCLGWIWCHMRRVEQSWAGRRFSFQVISLSPEILSAILEVLSSRLMNDTVFALPCEAGIWACWDTEFPIIHLTQVLALGLHPFLKGEGVGKDWVRLGCSWTLSLWALGCSLLNSCLPWALKMEAQGTKLKPIWSSEKSNWSGLKGSKNRTKPCFLIPEWQDWMLWWAAEGLFGPNCPISICWTPCFQGLSSQYLGPGEEVEAEDCLQPSYSFHHQRGPQMAMASPLLCCQYCWPEGNVQVLLMHLFPPEAGVKG